jgi:hypothetical protein
MIARAWADLVAARDRRLHRRRIARVLRASERRIRRHFDALVGPYADEMTALDRTLTDPHSTEDPRC